MISKSIAHYRVTKMLGKGGEGGEAGEVVVGMRVDTREATLEVIRKKKKRLSAFESRERNFLLSQKPVK